MWKGINSAEIHSLSWPSFYRRKKLADQAICLPTRQPRISIEALGSSKEIWQRSGVHQDLSPYQPDHNQYLCRGEMPKQCPYWREEHGRSSPGHLCPLALQGHLIPGQAGSMDGAWKQHTVLTPSFPASSHGLWEELQKQRKGLGKVDQR